MPYVNIKITREGNVTPEQKQAPDRRCYQSAARRAR